MVAGRAVGTLGAVLIPGIALLALSGGGVLAQDPRADAKRPKDAAQAAPRSPSMPGAEMIVLLLRTTLLTLNDALQTGNFTVLRDIGAPGFREANSAARLSAIFSGLTRRGVDLSAVAVIVPQLAEAPMILAKTGMLRLKGHFPGKPVRIDFEALYKFINGRWRLFGLSVQPMPVAGQIASEKSPPSQAAAGKAATANR